VADNDHLLDLEMVEQAAHVDSQGVEPFDAATARQVVGMSEAWP
jgi:hypothetical protein